jgi:hypothetical protein
LILVATILIASLIASSPRAAADETTIEITFANAGSLSIAWASGDQAFLVNGNQPGVSSSLPATIASATFTIAIEDTRADGERPGYAIALSATEFTAEGSLTPVPAQQFAIASVSASEGSGVVPTGVPQSLAAPVTLLTVQDEAQAVATTLTVVVEMTILPGTMPGYYLGTLMLEVLPLVAP